MACITNWKSKKKRKIEINFPSTNFILLAFAQHNKEAREHAQCCHFQWSDTAITPEIMQINSPAENSIRQFGILVCVVFGRAAWPLGDLHNSKNVMNENYFPLGRVWISRFSYTFTFRSTPSAHSKTRESSTITLLQVYTV